MISSRGGELTGRLLSFSRHHRNEKFIWDIGCDHGLLGLSFRDHELVEEIHLVDPSASVIEKLKLGTASHIPSAKLFIEQKKGQNIELHSSSNLIFIAGMGGKEMGEILESHGSQLDHTSRIVISPHKNILELRKKLSGLRFGIETEEIVKETGRFYQLLVLSKKADLPLVSPYGEDMWDHPLAAAYRDRELAHFSAHRDANSREYCRFLEQLSL